MLLNFISIRHNLLILVRLDNERSDLDEFTASFATPLFCHCKTLLNIFNMQHKWV